MQCKLHPGTPAKDRCAGCAETFCELCLVPIHGQHYCAACKVMALGGRQPTLDGDRLALCEDAKSALIMAVIALFCFPPILGIAAISKGVSAKREIDANPRLTGRHMATMAQLIAVVHMVVWGLSWVINAAMK